MNPDGTFRERSRNPIAYVVGMAVVVSIFAYRKHRAKGV